MQDLLSISIFLIPLIVIVASEGENGAYGKEWSTLLDQESPTVNGVGTWKARFMSEDTVNIRNMPKSKLPKVSKKTGDKDSVKDIQLNVSSSFKLIDNKSKNLNIKKIADFQKQNDLKTNVTAYANWIGEKEEHDSYYKDNFTQPAWQLPSLKLNASNEQRENLTVFPLSILHKIWESTDQIRRNGDFDYDEMESENDVLDDTAQHRELSNVCDDDCRSMNAGKEKGDTDTGESQIYHGRGKMGGGQPILLIKDKGDAGDMHPSPPGGKENLTPIIMMLTPLIMMCIMMPMMMSVMGGMMNFMRTMTTMITIMQSGAPLQPSLLPKYRKSDKESQNRANEFLNSFMQELSEKLEAAINNMVNSGILQACIMTFIIVYTTADSQVLMVTPKEAIRRTDWESMGGGWAPPPMHPPAPPKIILLKNQENEGGDKKEDKLEMLLPIIMSLGPLILIAILLPVFMSLLSGIMSFIKSLLAMKMMPVMPMNMLLGNGGTPVQTGALLDHMQKNVIFAGRNHNSSFSDSFSLTADDAMLTKNLSVLQYPSL